MKGNKRMGLWNFFKKKKKVQSGVCFSNEKSSTELVKNFLEAYSDEINAVSTENEEKLTEKTRKFYLELDDGRKITVIVNPDRNFLLKEKIGIEIFLEKLSSQSFRSISEENLDKYSKLFIMLEAVNKEEMKDEAKLLNKTANFLGKFHKFIIQKRLNHYHFGKRKMIQNPEKWELSDFIPPLSEKMFAEYNVEITDGDIQRKHRNIDMMKQNGIPYDENMEVSISEKNAVIRKKWDIIRKIVAIAMTRLAAETYLEKRENGQKELKIITDIFEERYQFKQVLSEREKNYLENPSDDKELNLEFYFMLEGAKMLLWVLSIIDVEFADFNTFCDVSMLIDGLKHENLKSFARKCQIRSKNKILDMVDYTYRLNWANVEIKLDGYERIVNESILYFSRLALEWVVQDGKSMDDIVIHT
ncbi:hypothetical protein GCWU000323_00721 [Leptotrichia hofstadii F0254]|uniref:Uncharacterized protein n=2 Tax=Leptotrichia hofstadii TaxID=157688 RepID=C9MVP9_9FUSO|nr:hypothetical protein GCWU000323_00721 [Leptotrichia hofstadii F0254]